MTPEIENILEINTLWFDAANIIKKLADIEKETPKEIANRVALLIEILNTKKQKS